MLSRLTSLLVLALLLTGCAAVSNLVNSAYNVCPSSTDSTETSHQYFGSPDADDLVVFIHGLCGDAKTTWTNSTTEFVFPEGLARDFVNTENQPARVFVFNYVSDLQGGPSILSIAKHLEFEIGELLKKRSYHTLRIVAHSMGGLVAREYILRRQPHAHPQLKVTNVVLLATPTNGDELSELARLVSENRQVEELRHIDKGNTYIESLNDDWNRQFKGGMHPRHVLLYAGYEEVPMPVLGPIVKLSSAIPYADESMGFQQNHVNIAKPKDGDTLYRWVKAKLRVSEEIIRQKRVDQMILGGLRDASATQQPDVGLEYAPKSEYESQLRNMRAEVTSYRFKAVRLEPENGWYRQLYGWDLLYNGDVKNAILEFEHAVRLSEKRRDSRLERIALGGLGVASGKLGQYAEAVEYHKKAHAISQATRDVQGEGRDLWNLSHAYANVGQDDKASESLRASEDLMKAFKVSEKQLRNTVPRGMLEPLAK